MAASPTPALLPAEVASDTVEALYDRHGAQRPWTYWLILVLAFGALASLPLIEVDVSVRAAGLVRPAVERSELRVPMGGLIQAVPVRENDAVRRGAVLLVLAAPVLDEKIALNVVRMRETAAHLADLSLLLRSVATPSSALDAARWSEVPLGGKDAGAGSARLVPAIKLDAPAFASSARRQDYLQLLAQLETLELRLDRARRELHRTRALQARGLVTDRDLDDARFAADSIAGECALLLSQSVTRWQADLADREAQRESLAAEARQLAEEKNLYTVRAPSDGALSGFSGLTAGAYVQPGQMIGALSPDEALRIECYISPRDIGMVRVGQAAHLQIDAFPYTQWGSLEGTVAAISADNVASNNPGSGFRVLVTLPRHHLTLPSGLRGELRKGMTAAVRLLIARRSLFSLLHQDVSDWLRP